MLRIIILSFSFSVSFLPSLAHACTNPTGVEAEIIYNTDHKVMQYCNGTTWISMAVSDGTLASLTEIDDVSDGMTPTDGQYLTWDNSAGEWIAADGVSGFKIPDDASVCDASTDGTIRYNSNKLQLCINGSGWSDVAGTGVTTGKFIDGTNTADAVYTTGNVGIGTATPTGLLHVDGQVLGNSFVVAQGVTGPAPSGYVPPDWKVDDSTAPCDAAADGILKYDGTTLSICINGTGWVGVGSASTGEWTANGSDIGYTTGNVGIGTTSPADRLEITGGQALRISRSDVASYSRMRMAGDGLLDIHVFPSTASGSANIRLFRETNTSSSNVALDILQGNNTTGVNTRLAGTGDSYLNVFNGNVGIGTASPQAKLHLDDTTSKTVWIEGDGDDTQRLYLSEAGDSGAYLEYSGSTDTAYLSHRLTGSDNATPNISFARGGNVGIATAVPNYPLDVSFSGDSGLRVRNSGSSHASIYIDAASGAGGYIRFRENGAENFWLNVDANGDLLFRPNGGGSSAIFRNSGAVQKPGGGSWAATSDMRLKEVKSDYVSGLEQIAALRPVTYRYKEGNERGEPTDQDYIGLVAQEAIEVMPELVSVRESDGFYDLDPSALTFALINAVKELKAENDNLRATVEAQGQEIEALKAAAP